MMPHPHMAAPITSLRERLVVTALLVLAATLFCLPLFSWRALDAQPPGASSASSLLFDSHEKLHYVIRLGEFHDALIHGQWRPRWCSNLAGGFGYPFFNFYAPLSYYLADVWHALGADLFTAWKLHFWLMAFLSAVGAFWYARIWLGVAPSAIAGLLYLFAPYHIANLYVRGNVAEFTAMTILPFLFGAYHRLLRTGNFPSFACAAVAFAALVLTHNITALFAAVIVAVYAIAYALRQSFKSARGDFRLRLRQTGMSVLLCAGAGVLGAMLSAFFWLPAVSEMKFTQGAGLSQTFAESPQHVVYWHQFFTGDWNFGDSLPGPNDAVSFSLGWLYWLLIGIAILSAFWRRSEHRGLVLGLAIGLFLLLLAMSQTAASLWTIPPFNLIQFPWRLLAFASLFASILAAAAAQFQPSAFRLSPFPNTEHRPTPRASSPFAIRLSPSLSKHLALGALIAAATVATSLPRLRVSSYFPNSAEMYRPENTRRKFITTNIGEFLPKWVRMDSLPGEVSQRRISAPDGAIIRHIPADSVTDFRFRHTSAASPSTITCEIFYFPGWKATADGKAVTVRPGNSGLIEFNASPGAAEYRVYYGTSPAGRAGWVVTGLGLAVFAAAGFWRRRK